MILRKIDGNDKAIKDVEALYLRAFPESERKPLSPYSRKRKAWSDRHTFH